MFVVGLVSSPRRGGNSELAVKEIFRQMPEDWDKKMIRLNELDIQPCDACYSCIPEGCKCRIHDDLDFVIRHVKHADKVVIAAPTYLLGCHTGIKKVMDRLLSIVGDYKKFPKRDCVIVSSYGMPGWEGLVKEEMQLFAKKLHLNVVGHEVMLATLPGDSVRGENLEKVTRLANLLIDGADGPLNKTTDGIECPVCGSTGFHIKPDGSFSCVLCSLKGRMVHGENGLELEYDPDCNHKFTELSLDEHVKYLMDQKEHFMATRKEVKAVQSRYKDLDWWVKPEHAEKPAE